MNILASPSNAKELKDSLVYFRELFCRDRDDLTTSLLFDSPLLELLLTVFKSDKKMTQNKFEILWTLINITSDFPEVLYPFLFQLEGFHVMIDYLQSSEADENKAMVLWVRIALFPCLVVPFIALQYTHLLTLSFYSL